MVVQNKREKAGMKEKTKRKRLKGNRWCLWSCEWRERGREQNCTSLALH